MSKNAKLAAEISGMANNEIAAIDFFVRELKGAEGKQDSIQLAWFVDEWNKRHRDQKITPAGGRRIIRHIRDHGLVKRLMADRYGYFIAENKTMWNEYMQMLERRVRKVSRTYNALKLQYR